MKTLVIILLVLAVAVWGYIVGHMTIPIVPDPTLDGMTQVQCVEYTRKPDGQLVCEINVKTEDQKILVYKEIPLE